LIDIDELMEVFLNNYEGEDKEALEAIRRVRYF